ncbi:proteasome assembly chaperone 2 isoform X2 [Fopius arisanus]|nr:PREDICTED: proteasome assembly chaperone 2 isoform X2 [Fopius arisanus]
MTSCFIPIIGGNPYLEKSMELCTSCDIYHNSERKLVVIQLRSPMVKKPNAFFQSVKEFVENHKIAKVVILTSGWAHTRTDVQIQSEPLRYKASPEFLSKFSQQIDSDWTELEKSPNFLGHPEDARIPGGGFAPSLYKFLSHNAIPTAILLRFCSEGDNIPDAVALMNFTSKWISLNGNEIKMPNSWKFLFGKPAPMSFY